MKKKLIISGMGTEIVIFKTTLTKGGIQMMKLTIGVYMSALNNFQWDTLSMSSEIQT